MNGTLKATTAAALLLLSAPAVGADKTIPAIPDDLAAFREVERVYRAGEADALILMKDFLNEFPSSDYSDAVILMMADRNFYEGNYPLAYSLYSQLRNDTFSGDLRQGMLYRKAFSMMKCGYYREARHLFREVASSKEYGDAADFYLAYIEYVEGNYDEAYRLFQQIKSRGYKGAEAEYYLNQIDYRRGDFSKVASTSDRLLTGTVPAELRGETMRVGGLSHFKLGNTSKARKLLADYALLAGDGAEISALYSLATIYYDEGDYDRAIPLFSTVTEYPGDLAQSAWLYLGQIYLARGEQQSAALAFDKAARESWNPSVAEAAAYNLAVTSTAGAALPFSDMQAMENFIDSYPDSQYAPALSTYLANAYYNRRDYREALRLLDRNPNPDASTKAMRQKILYQLGVSEYQQNHYSQAIQWLSEAADAKQPDREVGAQAALWLGDAYYQNRDYSKAVRAYDSALASGMLGENTVLARYNLGYAYMKLGNYAKAAPLFRDVAASKGLSAQQIADARLRYADCLYYTGKYEEALALFRSVKMEGGTDAAFAAIREADILGRLGKVSEKISILEGLLARDDTGIWRPTVISRLADAYSEKGDDRKAAEFYTLMLDNGNRTGDNTQTYYSLAANADNLYRIGDLDEARAAYRRIESSGIAELYPSAITGIMRSSSNPDEIIEYAAKVEALPGITAEERDEALFLGAQARLSSGNDRAAALSTLRALASSSDRLWGARAAVLLGNQLLAEGHTDEAEEVLLYLIDNGSDDNYWLARGYISLADVYSATDRDYLAKLYLETLQSNYPGTERDIKDMITSRLKKLRQ